MSRRALERIQSHRLLPQLFAAVRPSRERWEGVWGRFWWRGYLFGRGRNRPHKGRSQQRRGCPRPAVAIGAAHGRFLHGCPTM